MNTLVIVASGLHLGYVGCYGNEWVQTPALDRLAVEGIVFDQHYANQPDAAGGERAWRAGCYQFPWVKTEEELPSEAAASLFPLLAAQGVATYLISDHRNRLLSSEAAGWQHIDLLESAATEAASPAQTRDALVKAVAHLASYQDWLLRVDLGALLPPWNAPDQFRDRYASARPEEDESPSSSADLPMSDFEESEDFGYLEAQNRYAAAITYVDTGVGQILQELEERRLLEDMLVVVTSGRGQSLGEDTMRPGSGLTLHEELIHVPLLLRLPGKAEAGRRVNLLTQPVDLLPTLFEAFGVPLPAVHGQSILPLAKGGSNPIRTYACTGLRTEDRVEWALRSPDWFFLLPVLSASGLPADSELYVKPDDRWEINNVRQHHLELAEHLEQTLRGFVEATRYPGPLQPPELPDSQNHPEDSTGRSIPP